MIVRPSNMQRVAESISKLAPQAPEVPAQRPAAVAPAPTPLRYSEITPDMLRVLRIYAALESCYPQHGDRATRAVAGYAAWRVKQQAAHRGPSEPEARAA